MVVCWFAFFHDNGIMPKVNISYFIRLFYTHTKKEILSLSLSLSLSLMYVAGFLFTNFQ